MFKKFFFIFCILLCIQKCDRDSQYFFDKYKEAIKQEKDNQKDDPSEHYIHKAYEYSLPDHFFILGKKYNFTKLKVAKSYPMMGVLSRNKKGDAQKIFFYDASKKKYFSKKLRKNLLHYQISTNALYAVLFYYLDNQCYFTVLDIQTKKEIWNSYKNDHFIGCFQSMAISDSANVFYQRNNIIYMFSVSEKKEKKVLLETKLEPFLKNIVHKTNIEVIDDNMIFVTIGNLGVYKFYKIHNNTRWLIDKEISKDAIYFTRNGMNPIVYRGRAGDYSFVIYDKNSNNKIKEIKKEEIIQDISMINKNQYFYTVDNLIVQENNNIEKELPFLSKNIIALSHSQLFFLTNVGTLIAYNGESLSQNSIKIFQVVREVSD